ncbi:RHS repeat-associated core domain-containing protein [Paraglaciecola sp.]|uniref:RHS repeat-associated core domain-containing protein n=1 Tax=Paraglaciecola sp. TaxID=1920173 RepID=UPI0030F392FD
MNSRNISRALIVVIGLGAFSTYYFSGSDNTNSDDNINPVSALSSLPVKPQKAILDRNFILNRISSSYLKSDDSSDFSRISKNLKFHLLDTQDVVEKLKLEPDNKTVLGLLESKIYELKDLNKETIEWLTSNQFSESKKLEVIEHFERVDNQLTTIVQSKLLGQRAKAIQIAITNLNSLNSVSMNSHGKPQPTISSAAPLDIKPETFPAGKAPAYTSEQNKNVVLAPSRQQHNLFDYLGISSLNAAELPSAPLSGTSVCNVNSADTDSALPEVDITDPDIIALASTLDYSATKIYQYVRNNIAIQFYAGSVKGAAGTLKSGSGNNTDQASLVVALLRISQIPARYVKGTIQFNIDDDRFLNWTGTKTGLGAIQRLNRSNAIASNGQVVQLNHVWVEACVPYENYRGSNIDNSGHMWLPLDASFKQMAYNDGDVAPSDFSFDYDEYLTSRHQKLPQETLLEQLETHLGRTLKGIGYQGDIKPEKFDILPASLPYLVVKFLSWDGTSGGDSDIASLPDRHRVFVNYQLKNSTDNPVLDTLTLPLISVINKRITLSYEGVTAADRSSIDNWRQGTGNMPCTGVNVHAQFKGDGSLYSSAIRTSISLCTENLRLAITVPQLTELSASGFINQVQYYGISAYNHHALMVYGLQASEQVIESRNNKLIDAVGQNPDVDSLSSSEMDDTLGEYLHIAALKYMYYITNANQIIGQLYGGTGDSGFHIGLTSTAMKVDYLFDLPLAISGDAFLIDVPGGQSRSTDLTSGGSNFDSFVLAGYASSAYESYIWQEYAHLDAVSSVRGMQFANENSSIGIVNLSSAAQVDSKLNKSCPSGQNYSSSTLTQLKTLFNTNGFNSIKIPKCLIQYDNWLGAVWAATKNNNGSYQASYTISGGYTAGGGYTTGDLFNFSVYDANLGIGSENTYTPTVSEQILGSIGGGLTSTIAAVGDAITNGASWVSSWAGDPVNLVSGNFYLPEHDFSIKGVGGLNLAFARTYNSNFRKDGPLGFGWNHSLNHKIQFVGETTSGKATKAVWLDGTGGMNIYDIQWSGSTAQFTPQGALKSQAKQNTNGSYEITEKGGVRFIFASTTGNVGDIAKLSSIIDRNGNTLSFTYSGNNLSKVTNSLNNFLTFHYDDNDQHITRITDWLSRTWSYDYQNNNLVEVSTPLASIGELSATTYSYYDENDGINLGHAMESYTRPNGDSLTLQYFTNGKVFRHTNALGKTFTFSYNEYRRETTTVDEAGISQTYIFNQYGQQIEHVRGDGARTLYSYTDSANPFSETNRRNALGYNTQNAYNSSRDLILTTLPDGSTIEYSGHNSFHQPTKMKDPKGNYTLYRYDTNGNKTDTIKLKSGFNTTTPSASQIIAWSKSTFDTKGNILTLKTLVDFSAQTGPYLEYVYDANKLNVTYIKHCGLQYTGNKTLSDHCKQSPYQQYDALGRITTAVNGNFYTQQIRYDENGRVIGSTNDTNQWMNFSYDDNNNLINVSQLGARGDGSVGLLVNNTSQYDELNRNIRTSDTAGHATRAEYDDIGRLIKMTNADGYAVHFDYDNFNRPIRAYDEQGQVVETQYDQGGRPINIISPTGDVTQYQYYSAVENGRLQKVISADGTSVEYFYDNNGNVVRSTNNAGQEQLTEYDELNRVVRQVGPVYSGLSETFGTLSNVRQVTKMTYNNLGHTTEVWAGYTIASGAANNDQLKKQASYSYDDFGRLLTATDALNQSSQYVYDTHGNLISSTQANGHIIERNYLHDRNGLLDKVTAKLSATDTNPHVTTYKYNDLGQVTQVVSPEVTYSYTYDLANRLQAITDSRGNKTLSQDISPGGLLNSISDSDGKKVAYLYDAARRLTSIQAAGGEEVSFIYDAAGRLTEKRLSNGTASSYRYDNNTRLETITNTVGLGAQQRIISQHSYEYDERGRKKTTSDVINGSTKTTGYLYDGIGRLSQVNNVVNSTATLLESYQYDPFNNRKIQTITGAANQYYHYDNAQQLNKITSGSATGAQLASYGYDVTGNLSTQSKGGLTSTYTYDAFDRLVGLSQSGSLSRAEQYTYGPSGNRLSKTVTTGSGISATTTLSQYHYAGSQIWAEFNSSWQQALAHYSYSGTDSPIVRSTPNAINSRFYHSDALGSVVATSNSAGSSSADASQRFDAWGNVSNASGSISQYGYTGREPDGSGLTYYRARYYDPSIGRFTQRDPMGFADGINPYVYVANSPLNYTDPSGMVKDVVTGAYDTTSAYLGQANDGFNAFTSQVGWGGVGSELWNNGGDYAAQTGSDAVGGLVDNFPEASGYNDAVNMVVSASQGDFTDAVWAGGSFIIGRVPVGKVISESLGPLHHICTNKNCISEASGGPWTPRFEAIFEKAGMNLNDSINKINIPGHKGRHPKEYHQAVFDRLVSSTSGLNGSAYKSALQSELKVIGQEAATKGSMLNNLLTKTQP